MSGMFITFEGGEGAGKSTQIRLLAQTLETQGRKVVLTREPGGSKGAEQIRHLLVEGTADRWDGLTEALLLYAARRDHLRCVILPALAEGACVLCDRFNDSTLAYQGYGHGMPKAQLDALYQMIADGISPDLTLILDLPVAVGLQRAGRRGGGEDRYEGMEAAFHERLRAGFLAIAQDHPQRCRVIDATQDISAVQQAIYAEVMQHLPSL